MNQIYLNDESFLLEESDDYRTYFDISKKYFEKINFNIVKFAGNKIFENIIICRISIKDNKNNILKNANVFFEESQMLFVQIK